MNLILWVILLIISLFVLVKSADYFTNGAEKIGLYFGMSSFIVGATIVSIGTSMPEIVTSVLAIIQDKSSFPIDNIIGSNIANILLIGGISGIIAIKLKIKKELIEVDLPFFFLSTALFIYFIYDGIFNWKEGLVSLIILFIFILYTLSGTKEKEEKINKIFNIDIIRNNMNIFLSKLYSGISI